MHNSVSDFIRKDLTFIDFSGRVYTQEHLILAQNYYYQQLQDLPVEPQCVFINSHHLFTVIAAMSACWAHGIPVYYGSLPAEDSYSAADKEFYKFIQCIIGSEVDFDYICDQNIETKTDFVITHDVKIESVLPNVKNIEDTAFFTLPDNNAWPTGLVTLSHKDILDQCLYTNKSIGFNNTHRPVHPTRASLRSLISYTLPALVNCNTHYYDTDSHKRGSRSNYLYKKYNFCKKINATHVYISSVKNLDILLPDNYQTDFVFVTCDNVDIPVAQSLISDHGARYIVGFLYTESTGVYASNVVNKDNVESYVPFGMQDIDSDIEYTSVADGTLLKRNNKTSKLRYKISNTSAGYYTSNPITVFEKQENLLDIDNLQKFLSNYLDVTISVVPDYVSKKIHLFVFDADKLDISVINKHIYSKFIDIETNIENCIDSIHYISLDQNHPKPNQNLLLSLASKNI